MTLHWYHSHELGSWNDSHQYVLVGGKGTLWILHLLEHLMWWQLSWRHEKCHQKSNEIWFCDKVMALWCYICCMKTSLLWFSMYCFFSSIINIVKVSPPCLPVSLFSELLTSHRHFFFKLHISLLLSGLSKCCCHH